MKTKSILMSLLLAVGVIAAKAATGYPPELALVSQPVMVYNYNSITVYYDVENIGDYTYKGYVYIYLDPDYGYYYADEYVKVRPGSIKRIAIDIPARRIDKGYPFTIMPYYEVGDELYSFTTFEYFDPLSFYWSGPHNEPWVVVNVPPRVRVYTRPGYYRYYYDGFRPPMPPPHDPGHGPGTPPPPMDPKHHTYGYHHNNGGYPATHNVNPPAPHHNDGGEPAPSATVRPKANGGSMSSGNNHNGGNSNPPAPNSSSSVRPNNESSGSGRTPSSNGTVSRPSSNSRPGGTSSNSSNGRTGNSGVSRPNSSSSNNSGTSGSSSGSVKRSNSSNSRTTGANSSSSTRSSSSNRRSAGAKRK